MLCALDSGHCHKKVYTICASKFSSNTEAFASESLENLKGVIVLRTFTMSMTLTLQGNISSIMSTSFVADNTLVCD